MGSASDLILQPAHCGTKAAIRGFTNSLRSDIIHDKLTEQHGSAIPTGSQTRGPAQADERLAGALPFMLTTLLGLEIDSFERRIIARRPMLPPGVQQLRLVDLKASRERIMLDVMTADDGGATVVISGAAWSLQHDEHVPGG